MRRVVDISLVLAPLAVLVAWIPETWQAPGMALSIGAVALAAAVDLRERRLPDVLTVPATGAALATVGIVALIEGAEEGGDVALSVAAGAALLAGPLLVAHLVSPAGMGFGDVKAGLALGAAIGLIDAWSALVALFIGSSLTAAAGLLGRERHVPFGPGLVVGAALALVAARVGEVTPAG